MLIAIVPLLVAVCGVLVFALTENGKLSEVARACMWGGVFVTLMVLASRVVRLG